VLAGTSRTRSRGSRDSSPVSSAATVGEYRAGFLGALLIGLIAGCSFRDQVAPRTKYVKPIMPILIIPIVSSLLVGVLMIKVIGTRSAS